MNQGGAVISLTYNASNRIIPGYGGGMSSAKAVSVPPVPPYCRGLRSSCMAHKAHVADAREGLAWAVKHAHDASTRMMPCMPEPAWRATQRAVTCCAPCMHAHVPTCPGPGERHARAGVRGRPQVWRARQHHQRRPAGLARRQGHRLHRRHDPVRARVRTLMPHAACNHFLLGAGMPAAAQAQGSAAAVCVAAVLAARLCWKRFAPHAVPVTEWARHHAAIMACSICTSKQRRHGLRLGTAVPACCSASCPPKLACLPAQATSPTTACCCQHPLLARNGRHALPPLH